MQLTPSHFIIPKLIHLYHTSYFGIRPEPPHMCISHKWSHTETIHQAQSQSHNLTSSHKIPNSYISRLSLPISHFHFFPCDHYWNYPLGSVPNFTSVKAIHQAQPYYHTFSSPSGTIPYIEIPDQSSFKYQFTFHNFIIYFTFHSFTF